MNPRPERVSDPVFLSEDFFDVRDLVQAKYEMLRRVRVDGASITDSATAFGFSRPTYYQAEVAFETQGLAGLISSKPGPRHAHKLSGEVLDFLEEEIGRAEPSGSSALAEKLRERFGLEVHPRSIERALERRRQKKTTEAGISRRQK